MLTAVCNRLGWSNKEATEALGVLLVHILNAAS